MATQEKIMIVTGATGGIGLTTARELAATGARVVLVGRSEARLADAVAFERLGRRTARLVERGNEALAG